MGATAAAGAALAGMDRPTRIVVSAAIGSAALQATMTPPPVNLVTGMVLMVVAPGFVVARGAFTGDAVFLVVVSVATSLALDVLTASLLLYLRLWSGERFAVSMALVTVVAALVTLRTQRSIP